MGKDRESVLMYLYPNGRVLIDSICSVGSGIYVGRAEFMTKMGELYDEFCLTLTDITEETIIKDTK